MMPTGTRSTRGRRGEVHGGRRIGQHDEAAIDQDLGVHDGAILPRHPHPLLGPEGAPVEVDRGGGVRDGK